MKLHWPDEISKTKTTALCAQLTDPQIAKSTMLWFSSVAIAVYIQISEIMKVRFEMHGVRQMRGNPAWVYRHYESVLSFASR